MGDGGSGIMDVGEYIEKPSWIKQNEKKNPVKNPDHVERKKRKQDDRDQRNEMRDQTLDGREPKEAHETRDRARG